MLVKVKSKRRYVSHRIMGQDSQKRRRRQFLKHAAVQTIFNHRPQSSKPGTVSFKHAAKSECKKVSEG